MSLGIDLENVQISEFETIYDESLPKLFKKINYYINTDYMQKPKTKVYSETDVLDLPEVIKKQQLIFQHLDNANYYLSQNLEETTDLVDRVSVHRATADNSLTSIVQFIENWLVKSNQELNTMDDDLAAAESDVKILDLDKVVSKTMKKIENLKVKISDNAPNFKRYEELSGQLKTNRAKIQKTMTDMKGFKEKLKKFLDRRRRKGNNMGMSYKSYNSQIKTSNFDLKNNIIFYKIIK